MPRVRRYGQERLYVVRQVLRFLREWHAEKAMSFSKKFTLEPRDMSFGKKEGELLEFLYVIYCDTEDFGRSPAVGTRTLPLDRYAGLVLKKLEQRGREKLDECAVLTSFESEIEPRMTYQYKVDYRLGDIVTLVNEYGVTVFPRITEIIESFSDEGYKVIPVFEKKEVG